MRETRSLIPLVLGALLTAAVAVFCHHTSTLSADGLGIIHVDVNAPGPGHDGSSWTTAYTDLQDALEAALSPTEIWVADGVYTPTVPPGQEAEFAVPAGTTLLGGFAGYGVSETLEAERDWRVNITVLSGDLDGDDGVDAYGIVTDTDNIVGDNAYHVVTVREATDIVLDGFHITAGDAQVSNQFGSHSGGGVYVFASDPEVRNVILRGNRAALNGSGGGGMINLAGASSLLAHVVFMGNSAGPGGGLANVNSDPSLLDVAFLRNTASGQGGGMRNYGSAPELIGCSFLGNQAAFGGAVHNMESSHPRILNSVFAGNQAGEGGAIFDSGASASTLINVTIGGNHAIADVGGVIGNNGTSLTNCILWGNTDPSGFQISPAGLTVTYSLIQSAYAGQGNIWDDPLFLRATDDGGDGWGNANDDYGDLGLQPSSPAIDAGDSTAVPTDTLDLDGDGITNEPLPLDFDGNARFLDHPRPDTGNGPAPIIDMGAWEIEPVRLYLPLVVRGNGLR